MKVLLVQQKVAKALLELGKLPATLTKDEKEEMCGIAYSSIILHLVDNVLRRVSKIENVSELWVKLEELYMPKTLTNQIYLKEGVENLQLTSIFTICFYSIFATHL